MSDCSSSSLDWGCNRLDRKFNQELKTTKAMINLLFYIVCAGLACSLMETFTNPSFWSWSLVLLLLIIAVVLSGFKSRNQEYSKGDIMLFDLIDAIADLLAGYLPLTVLGIFLMAICCVVASCLFRGG